MIEDTSVIFGRAGSWTDLSGAAFSGFTRSTLVPTSQTASDRALIVYQNADDAVAESEVVQLLARARVILPAVMNYLYFNSAQVAVVYFGKRVVDGKKVGIRAGAEDFKIRMIRFLTSEIWPTLLRTDVPDESLGADYTRSYSEGPDGDRGTAPAANSTRRADTNCGTETTPLRGVQSNSLTAAGAVTQQFSRETAQEISWFKKSIENRMQVLLYLKSGVDGTKYLKVILNNNAQRIHFDVIDTKEEKYRWELRMLFTRLMDNLETQKAIESYDAYEANFRLACATAAANAVELERPLQAMTPVTMWGTAQHDKPLRIGVPSTSEDEDATNESDFSDFDRASEDNNDKDNNELHCRNAITTTSEEHSPESRKAGSRCNSVFVPAALLHQPDLPMSRTPTPAGAEGGARTVGSKSLPSNMTSKRKTVVIDVQSDEGEGDVPLLQETLVNNDTFSAKSRGTTLNPSKTRYYRWMENLQRPESATLDYKSYFSYTALEIRHRCVRFMCGFLNAYREGKLVIGVHEIPRRDADGKLDSSKGGKNSIVLHNDLVDQFVVGVRITESELEDVQEDVSQQLLSCVPPIPPQTVAIDVVPVVYPEGFAYSRRVLILYEENSHSPSRDSLKQKSNYAIRFLNPLGLSIIPLDLVDDQLADHILEHRDCDAEPEGDGREDDRDDSESGESAATRTSQKTSGRRRGKKSPVLSREFRRDCLKAEAYVIAATGDASALTESGWEELLSEAISGAKSRCQHFFLDWPTETAGPLVVPPLHVVEVSVDIKRCPAHALASYKGKFFTGWPSIPIWDAATRTVRRVERNYNLFGDAPTIQDAAILASSMRSLSVPGHGGDAETTPPSGGAGGHPLSSPTVHLVISASANGFQRAMLKHCWTWFANLQIMNNVLAYLYGPRRVKDVLQFRCVHPVWNRVFENRQGTPLVHMIHSTPVGVPMFNNSTAHISRTQYAFLREGVPPMPLILCRVYEIIGNLPSPYPFVTVPLVQQSFRVSSFLIPIFYRQHYFDGTMRISVVLDLRDGILKTMQMRDGNLVLEAIVGMCFEKMNRRQVTRQLERIAAKAQEDHLRQQARAIARSGSRVSTPRRDHGQSGKYASNFLARRTLQPQLLRRSRGRLSSTVLSPMQSESMRLTAREVEPNIPLIHFQFLTRKPLEDRSLAIPDVPHPSPFPSNSTSAAALSPMRRWDRADDHFPPRPPPSQGATAAEAVDNAVHRTKPPSVTHNRDTSWTLQHLLSWYNALLTDSAHLRVFGYCERSIAFSVADFSEICEDDVETGALDLASTKDVTFAPCREACTLHRKVREWMEV